MGRNTYVAGLPVVFLLLEAIFFFFLGIEIEIAFFFFAVWPVLDSISFGTHVIGRMIAIAIKDFQKTR